MGSETATPTVQKLPLGRLIGIGLIVFWANAALLVLQLVAGRLLAPFIGSSIETWTSVIGVFLTGIALGNAFGGRLADRLPSPRTLAIVLALGAVAALWMALFPRMLASSGVYKSLPLGPRIPILALALCLPAGFFLSLLTPLAIKLGLPDVSKTGRVAGMIFGLSTFGCLLGNYLTGFVLIPAFTVNTLVYFSAGVLVFLSVGTFLLLKETLAESAGAGASGSEKPVANASGSLGAVAGAAGSENTPNPHAFSDIRIAFLVVFLASFCGMSLEFTASRILAEFLGVSLFTWTGIIGVMLAGTAFGNLAGGWLADRVTRPESLMNPRTVLASTLICAGAGVVLQFIMVVIVRESGAFKGLDPITQVIGWTFSLFFVPMFLLGMISPQVIRIAVPDVAHVGRVAGRVYAWSTAGAIAGSFATSYVLLSTLGMKFTLLAIAMIVTLISLLVDKVWDKNLLLYLFSIVLGGVTGGAILIYRSGNRDPSLVAQYETNYYTIKVTRVLDEHGNPTSILQLNLDYLIHSRVDPDDPSFLYYTHEHVQMEFLRHARGTNATPKVLVIGGGGYTFPRYAMEMLPETTMDVVEIDPGVTKMAREYLGLKDYDGMRAIHMDGRQFIAEKAVPHSYDVIAQDAVNDLSVPSHLLTKEYNDAVKHALAPKGVYLLTVIDSLRYGRLWRSAMRTLRETFPHVELVTSDEIPVEMPVYRAQLAPYLAAARSLPSAVSGFSPSWGAFANEAAIAETEKNLLGEHKARLRRWKNERQVLIIYASDEKLDADRIRVEVTKQLAGRPQRIYITPIPQDRLTQFTDTDPGVLLTDQYAPVDNLMAGLFRYREKQRPLDLKDDE